MSADRPLWLLVLVPLVAATVAIHARGLSGVGERQRRAALWVRIVLLSLVVGALAGMRLDAGGDSVAVVFVVDRSDSVDPAERQRAERFIEDAVRTKGRRDRVAVVAFGRDPQLEFTMTDRPALGPISAAPDASATDLARALRVAAALFPEGTKRRIVVLSDGRETTGDARREAARLRRAGIVVEGVTLGGRTGGDPLIESFAAPSAVRRGERFPLAVTLRSEGGPAHLTIYRNGRVMQRSQLALRAGATTIPFEDTARRPRIVRYQAELRVAGENRPQNDHAAAAVVVEGAPRVLVVEGERGEADALVAALRAGRLLVDRRAPRDLPRLAELLQYSATVLVDVPADALVGADVGTLRAAVSEAGAGLLTIGGEDSYGPGGYRGSELESLLPVESDIRDPKRRPSVAEALVVDTSGSMAACHCAGGAMGGEVSQSGINKTDISRAGAARAVRALSADDIVGVLAFNTESKWVVPLQKLPPEDVLEEGLRSMAPEGGTNIPQALRAAVGELRLTKAKLKHIILFTDGWTNQRELVGVARDVARQGITLSVVATGEGTGDVLAKMAQAGRGRFYAGTNLHDVPQVMMQEAILASRNFVNEGVFSPIVTAETPVTQSLRAAPALLGYIATSAKAAASVDLEVGTGDPLLATWRAGLGTVVSWTSDTKGRWARPWLGWAGFRDFWTRAVRSTFPSTGAAGIAAEARVDAGILNVRVSAERTLGEGTEVVARIVDPTFGVREVPLERVGGGAFEGELPVSMEGTYLVSTLVRHRGAPLFRRSVTAILPYSAEYLGADPDPSMIPDLARTTRGRATIEAADAFDPRGLRASEARRELWPLLTLLAALLLPVDIAIRRLVVSREDLARGLMTVRRRLRRPQREGPREERIERLMEAKRRARRDGG